MGRHKTKALEYFNIDCIQQDNLNYVEARHGIVGYGVFIKLLRKIYMVEGYYCDFTEKNLFLFSKEIGVAPDDVKEILKTCLEEGIFSGVLYDIHLILTSAGIQKRWLKIVTDAKRKDREIESKFLLLNKTPVEIQKTPDVIDKTLVDSTQSKVEYSKVNESKVGSEGTGKPDAQSEKKLRAKKTREGFIPPVQTDIENYLLETVGDSRKPGAWPEDRCKNVALEIFLNYKSNGWVQNKGKPIVDWKAAVGKWAINEIKGTYSHNGHQAPAAASVQSVVQSPQLSKEQVQFNDLYSRYLQEQITVISVDAAHYHYLKNSCGVIWSEEQKQDIETTALKHIDENKIVFSDVEKLKYMKKYAVLEFFKKLQQDGRTSVFELELLTA